MGVKWLWGRTWVRRGFIVAMVVGPMAVVAAVASWVSIRVMTGERIYTAATVPSAPVAIVLGAGLTPEGTPKPYLEARLQDAKALYDSGKVRVLLVTGDNGTVEYDEVTAMRTWLAQHGVPAVSRTFSK